MYKNNDFKFVQCSSYDASGRVKERLLGGDNTNPNPILQTNCDYFNCDSVNGQGCLREVTSGVPSDTDSLRP